MTRVRPSGKADAAPILRIARSEPLFTKEDREVVEELLQEFLADPGGDYFFLTALDDGKVAGFACYGPTPLTRGTYDLYWICVARSKRRKGYGRALLRSVVGRIRREGGRLITLDTSGRPSFAATRAFYEREGFKASARIADFYRRHDDLVIYTYPIPRA
ncbi:MAG TPA: GNAT family N-acetyltransferase [Anaerolineales bacterium]|nr:GNAT family N-acetyltransferase [Anaerolineales bacterium]